MPNQMSRPWLLLLTVTSWCSQHRNKLYPFYYCLPKFVLIISHLAQMDINKHVCISTTPVNLCCSIQIIQVKIHEESSLSYQLIWYLFQYLLVPVVCFFSTYLAQVEISLHSNYLLSLLLLPYKGECQLEFVAYPFTLHTQI